ncbi:hypothetical protein [Draconibacterium sediminis]|uniref:hypothetical protein n=1 Tax=Draconibacterium sediminis TaxID=1544798 RepID=UPI0026EB8955|nr:hypothetical protein [Draconibacterium sediminis]
MAEIDFDYYIFGSEDSIDTDVLIVHPDSKGLESDSQLIKQINETYPITRNWNINIIKIEDGVIINSIPSKGNPDSVNNSLFETYNLHEQKHPFPQIRKVKRNKDLAIEKCLVSIFTFYKRTIHHEFYKTIPKEIKNGKANTKDRLSFLEKIDFNILPYNEDIKNKNAFKSLAFHVGQTISLLNGIEIYTKQKLITHHPDLAAIVSRTDIGERDVIKRKIIILKNSILNYYKSKEK